jgi:HprK-related kinase A
VTTNFHCLGFEFGVAATNPDFQRMVDALYAPFRAPVEVTTVFTLVERAAPGDAGVSILIFENDKQVRTTPDRALALAHLVWRVSQRVISTASESFLLLHAAAVERDRNAVLLPAPSGSGKSTLSAGLVAAGFGYLTDDVCAIDLDSGRVRPHPKPISLATEVVRQFERNGSTLLRDDERAFVHTDAYVTSANLGGRLGRESTARTIVVPTYAAGSATNLTAMSRAEAVIVLGEQSFNFNELAPAALSLVADVVRGCDCFRLTYADLDAAVGLIAAAAAP